MRKALVIILAILTLGLAGAGLLWITIKRAMPDPDVALEVVSAAPDVYWIKGGVSNMGFVVGKTGVIAIDTELYDATTTNALAEIRKVTPKPVRTVVITHSDPDHVNGLPGLPQGIEVIAHPRTRTHMLAALGSWKPNPTAPSGALRG